MAKVKDIDRGWKKIKQGILRSKKRAVLVGIRGQGTGKSSLATIGLYHEKGGKNGRPPKRSFIGSEIDQNKSKYSMMINHVAARIISGKIKVKKGLYGIGSVVSRNIKARIRRGIAPKLAESTKKRKAKHGKPKNTPLIFHGRLINSISFWFK